nr:DEAD-box ATP-dependent RNA helicase 36 [Tanacetum cinerariifolium]
MTSNLQSLLEVSANRAYFYEAYAGFQTVDTLKQQYIHVPKAVKDVYLLHVLSRMEDMGIRSAIIFVSRCVTCNRLGYLLEELEQQVAALHSYKSQSSRLSALHKFKSGKVPVLVATDVASRGLDIPTVDLVINYDIPRDPRDYVHRVGRTARAGRGGLAMSLVTPSDVKLVQAIEKETGKEMEQFKCKEDEVLEEITKVFKATRVAKTRLNDDGYDEMEKTRKEQKRKSLAEKGLLKKNKRRKQD